MNQYCNKCGNILTKGSSYCMFCGAHQPAGAQVSSEYIPPQAATGMAQPTAAKNTQKSVLGIVAIITAAVVVVICTASYFLFFAARPADNSDIASIVEEASEAWTEQAQAPSDDGASDDSQTIISSSQSSPAQDALTVSDQTITVSMDYDSGEGIYSGEVNSDGVPDGYGTFEMVISDSDINWSYEGQWAGGVITGEGVMTQGDFIFTGSFNSGLLDGYCEIVDNGILRYAGLCAGGSLHGQGTLYTSTGILLFEGEFQNDMLVESEASRQARGVAFKPECIDMDDMLYDACMAEDNMFGYPVAVWGFPLAMGEQTANGTIVIGHMGDNSYPFCLVYRYGVDEPKMTSDDWINAWGVVAGLYEYVDGDGLTVTCPMVEVVFWDNEQEGL